MDCFHCATASRDADTKVYIKEVDILTSFAESRDWFELFFDDVFAPPKLFNIVIQWLVPRRYKELGTWSLESLLILFELNSVDPIRAQTMQGLFLGSHGPFRLLPVPHCGEAWLQPLSQNPGISRACIDIMGINKNMERRRTEETSC